MPDMPEEGADALDLAVVGARTSVAPRGMSTRIIAVDGPGGAGKSTFADRLASALGGESSTYQPTTWGDEVRPPVTVQPDEFVVLEGVTASRRAFLPYLAFTTWIDTPRDVRLKRGLARDGEKARSHWEGWMAEEDVYMSDEGPMERVDLIVSGIA